MPSRTRAPGAPGPGDGREPAPILRVRVGKIALIRHQRYAHAKQFKRATRALRSIRTMLGRVIRDITRKIVGRAGTRRGVRAAALAGSPGQGSAPAPAWPEALLAACSRG